LGWTADGHLQLSHCRLEVEFVDIKPEGKIRRIASYKNQLLHTSIDGQWICPQDLPHMRRDDNRRAIEAAMGAFCSYPPNVQHCIVAVVWSGDNAWRPHVSFLTRCEEIKPDAKTSASSSQQQFKTEGRFRYTPDFNDVWYNGSHYDLRTRAKARSCLQFLLDKKAFSPDTALSLESEIDPYVRKHSGDLPKTADIRIHHYFTDTKDKRRRLQRLKNEIIRAAGRNGRFYLKLD
jgi:hypothetical protein